MTERTRIRPSLTAAGRTSSSGSRSIERRSREYVANDPVYFVDEYVGGDTVLPADAPFAVDACKELAFEYQPAGSE